MKDRLSEWGYAAGWRLVRMMPYSMAWPLFRAGADRAAGKGGPGIQRLARNLSCVLGEPATPDQVREAVRSYARYWLEAFQLPSKTRAQHRESFRLRDVELLIQAHHAGTGGVVALPHAGNWDAAGAMVTAHGVPVTTVAERLRPEGLFKRFVAFRESLGMQIIPLTPERKASGRGDVPPHPDPPRGEPPSPGMTGAAVMDRLIEAIGQAHIVPLLADRDLSARGIEVEFLGGRTRMPAGPALLALRTGAPLFIVNMWYEPDLPCGQVIGPLPVPAPDSGSLDQRVRVMTQQVADELAKGIAANPVDWHMLQKLWLTEPVIREA